jgi:hypothetical protein
MEEPLVQASMNRLAVAGELAGFSVEQMIRLLQAGISASTLMDLIEARLRARVSALPR